MIADKREQPACPSGDALEIGETDYNRLSRQKSGEYLGPKDIFLFRVIFSFSVIFFSTPRGHTNTTETLHTFDGWRVGRNPPSVPSSICLIGEPAPPAEDHRRLHPLSQRSRSPFHPASSPPSGTPGRTSHHRHTVPGRVSFLRSHTGSRLTRYVLRFRLVGGVSSKHTAYAMGSVTAHRLATRI